MFHHRTVIGGLHIAFLFSAIYPAQADWLSDISKNFGKKSQDIGRSIEKSVQDTAKSIEKGTPATEQSPSDPCANNRELPQCRDLDKGSR
jgi:hypothetical protein